jgi:hypothetical protein
MSSFKDITGRRFGKLVAKKRVGVTKHGSALWECECDCGGTKVVGANRLLAKTKPTKSCGCLKGGGPKTHGKTDHPLYSVWVGMNRRCRDPKHDSYKNYGARGIYVDDKWRDSFAQFLADVGERPSPRHSLERVDFNGPYCPSNVKWATSKEQQRNRRCNRVLPVDGEALCLAEWAERVGINANTLAARIDAGWAVEDAVFTPVGANRYDEKLAAAARRSPLK